MDKQRSARIKVTGSMLIYGSIALFVKYISMPSSVIAMLRAAIGTLFLLLVMRVTKKKLSTADIRRNGLMLLISGAMLGFNWILLFEAYRYTTVATATLCYYFAPMILVAVSPFAFGEKMTVRKLLCLAAALVGMYFVSGVAENGIPSVQELRGVLLALASAVLYAAIVFCNKKINSISPYDKTLTQLAVAAVILLPYNLIGGSFAAVELSALSIGMMIFVGMVHTGFAYLLYFGSTSDLPAQTLAILSYIDPVVAVILSAAVLHENVTVFTLAGAVLILGAAVISELPGKAKKNG